MNDSMNLAVEEVLNRFRLDPEEVSGVELRQAFKEELPLRMLEEYRNSKDWKVRINAVRYAKGYSRRSEAAVDLAKAALFDKSKHVRFEACALLACSLRSDALPFLLESKQKFSDTTTQEGVVAAIDAIEHRNHAYFWDRDHSGKVIVNFEAPILP